MASELSNYLATAILNWVKGSPMPTAPATVYIGVFNGDPTHAGTGGAEVTQTIRAAGRVAIPLAAVVNRETVNNAVLDFGVAEANATITHGAVFDAATGGNMLTFSPLNTPRGIVMGDPVVVPNGDLKLNFN